MAKLEITLTPAAKKYISERSDYVQLVETRNSMLG